MNRSRILLAQPTLRHSRLWALSLCVLVLLLATACQPDEQTNPAPMSDPQSSPLTAKDFAPLHRMRIFFMHQSVGKNLMDGVEILARDAGIEIPLEQRDADSLSTGFANNGIIHAYGGKNRFPETKIASFAEQLSRFPPGKRPDVAMMKFCFIDFDTDTDVNSLFAHYSKTLDTLEKRYPEITFAHMTVPLMQFPRTFKARIKRMLGFSVWVDVTNARREEFSKRIREQYPANRVFDIARYESTYPNGQREMRTENGRSIFGLVPAYTDDGSHLNESGKRFVARHFLDFLGVLAENLSPDKTTGARD